MGNICRSPLAEGVFRHQAELRGVGDRFVVESAGTGGWHAGERADPRARQVAAANGITLSGTARQVRRGDFDKFHHLICMDLDNHRELARRGAPPDRLRLLLEVDKSSPVREVPDPYYGGDDGFQHVFELISSACAALLDELTADDP